MWFDENCKIALDIKGKARLKVIQNPSNENKLILASRQRVAKKNYKNCEEIMGKTKNYG